MIAEGEGVGPALDRDRSGRPFIEYDRTDPVVSSECPGETGGAAQEKMRSPRPILKMIGPTGFFADMNMGGRGRPFFYEAGVAS